MKNANYRLVVADALDLRTLLSIHTLEGLAR